MRQNGKFKALATAAKHGGVTSVIALTLLVGTFVPSSEAGSVGTRTIHFSARFSDPGSRLTGLGHCSPTEPGICSFHGEGIAFYRAPLTTVDQYSGDLGFNPLTQSFYGDIWDTETGFLTGCGEGSFMIHRTDFKGPTNFDPVKGTFRLTMKWTVLPGSGTGHFTGARGSGTEYADLKPDFSNTGVSTGYITCRS